MAYQRWEPIKGTNSLTLPARQNGMADAREYLSPHIPGKSMIEVNSLAAHQQICSPLDFGRRQGIFQTECGPHSYSQPLL